MATNTTWDKYMPKGRIGTLSPLTLFENGAFEFYRIAPKDVMQIYFPVDPVLLSNAPYRIW